MIFIFFLESDSSHPRRGEICLFSSLAMCVCWPASELSPSSLALVLPAGELQILAPLSLFYTLSLVYAEEICMGHSFVREGNVS